MACRSGADQSEIEPFGLVVAFLEAGAELVTATRWTLPTDRAVWNVMDDRGDRNRDTVQYSGPLNKAAHAVDAVLRDRHPVRRLGDWQRSKLRDWCDTGSLADSPVFGASLANHHAPPRTVGR